MHRQEEGQPKGAAAARNATPDVTCAAGVCVRACVCEERQGRAGMLYEERFLWQRCQIERGGLQGVVKLISLAKIRKICR